MLCKVSQRNGQRQMQKNILEDLKNLTDEVPEQDFQPRGMFLHAGQSVVLAMPTSY